MINRIIEASLKNRFVVLVAVAVLIAVGIRSLTVLPIGAVPDITPVQVQILTNSPGLAPEEVEQFVTFPVEAAMSGLPRVKEIRSTTRFGLSAVTIYFEEGTDIYWARSRVLERLPAAREAIPEGFGEPEMGPISTGLGQVYQFQLVNDDDPNTPEYSLMELRSILDWDVGFRLRSVPGIVEVNTWGGKLKTYEVTIDPDKLLNYGISINRVFAALRENNASTGGGYLLHQGEQWIIRGEGLAGGGDGPPEEALEDIRNIVLDSREDGTPIYIKDIAEVRLAPMIRQGAVSADAKGETVIGLTLMLWGENGRAVVQRVREKIKEIQQSLPPGVVIKPFYDRTHIVRRTIQTVIKNLTEGGILVIVVLFLLLGSLRGGVIVALAIPISMLGAFVGMLYAGYAGNLMSLGAIDFGLIVDGSVVMIENLVRRVAEYQKGREGKAPISLVADACKQVGRPVVFGVGIIIVVYLPILTLRGIEGKMFRPMAFTVVFALVTSLVLALTLMPVLASIALRSGVSERETFLVRWAKRVYRPLLSKAMRHPALTFATAIAVFGVSVWIASGFGATFIPKLDEGDIALQAWRVPSSSVDQAVESNTQIERVLIQFPEVKTVVSRSGRAELATDPHGVEISDTYVILKEQEHLSPLEWPLAWIGLIDWPEDKWPTNNSPENIYRVLLLKVHSAMTGRDVLSKETKERLRRRAEEIYAGFEARNLEFEKDQLIHVMNELLMEYVPANSYSFTQPIELRFQELIAGVRSDIGISLYGPDLDKLKEYGDRIAAVIQKVPGASEVRPQEIAGLPSVRIRIDRKAIARYGINAADVLAAVRALNGAVVGQVLEGQPRFFVQVRYAPHWRDTVEKLKHLKITDPLGRQIPLDQLAKITVERGPALITRKDISRRLLIEANVRGRDLASFVFEAQRAVREQVQLPPGYYLTWGGQFKNLQEASQRLMIAVPVSLFLIFALLYTTFNSFKPALLIYLNVPMAATGGIFALWLRGMPFSISAGVGFIALFGVAVLNGLVLVEYVLQLRREGKAVQEAAFEGALLRMRPVLMTALVASLGFVPMAISQTAGAEVQRPLATVVIGGLITSTLLTLLVLPAIYRWFEPKTAEIEV
ncbi:MAG: efflux RND transporter permease subunit [Planctomycetes bacterium]|nr:efflux RND transporter permease subunit [Planctomycetota bacterium]